MADSKLNELSLITTPTMNSPLYTVESSSDKRMLVKNISQVIGDENIAPAYDATETYSEGDYCMQEGKLYQCNTAIATPEAFDATKWDAVKVTEITSGASVIQLTQAEYTALSSAEKMNGSIYKLTDKAIFYCLDEEYHAVKELTTAQYEALTSAEQNNGTIYIQTDAETTGSDIPVSTGATETIAEAIDSLTSPIRQTITAGSNITSFEAQVFKTGKAVNGYIVFKPTATVADTNTVFASGLPIPASDRLMIIFVVCVAGTNAGKANRVAVNANGELISWYHTSGFFNTTDTYFVATNYAAK